MKLKVTFIKDHPSGFKKGKEASFVFIHAARLIDEGYVEPVDSGEFDSMSEAYKKEQEDIKNKIEKRLADLRDARNEEENWKEEMRQKAHGEGSSKHARMSTADINKEEEKPSENKKGGKKK